MIPYSAQWQPSFPDAVLLAERKNLIQWLYHFLIFQIAAAMQTAGKYGTENNVKVNCSYVKANIFAVIYK